MKDVIGGLIQTLSLVEVRGLDNLTYLLSSITTLKQLHEALNEEGVAVTEE